jgi:cytochrome d ubiquinol oxidase subunit I
VRPGGVDPCGGSDRRLARAFEGLYNSQEGAPLILFALPYEEPRRLEARVEIPGLVSWLVFGDVRAPVKGLNEFPADEIPPLWLTFVSFHNMVILGMLFIATSVYGTWRMWRGKLFEGRRFLWLLVAMVPLSLAACQFGWMAAEAGRQPWIVYRVMRTADAFSSNLTAGEVLFSLILFSAICLTLLCLYLWLLVRTLRRAAQESQK